MKLLVFLVITSFAACLARRGRVIGGQDSRVRQFPYTVALTLNLRSHCAGSLISSMFVITAGHCLANKDFARVELGAHNRLEPSPNHIEQTVFSSNFKIHENYNENTSVNDIGLIELNEPVVFNEYIRSINLPRISDIRKDYVGAPVVVSGWGLVENRQRRPTVILQYANLIITTNRECQRWFGPFVSPLQICSNTYNRRTCRGDSGSPVAFRETDSSMTLIGIVSFGLVNCSIEGPSIFTRVTSYLNWIRDNTNLMLRP